MGNSVQIDVEAWPLVIMRMPEALDPGAIKDWMEGIDAVLARKARFSAVVDTRPMKHLPNAVERRQLIEQLNRRTFAERTYNIGNGVVINSAAARAALTAINWVRPPIVKQHLVGSFPAALDWCCNRLAAAGVGITPAIWRLREQRRPSSVPAAPR